MHYFPFFDLFFWREEGWLWWVAKGRFVKKKIGLTSLKASTSSMTSLCLFLFKVFQRHQINYKVLHGDKLFGTNSIYHNFYSKNKDNFVFFTCSTSSLSL